jgi:hypothetical protein
MRVRVRVNEGRHAHKGDETGDEGADAGDNDDGAGETVASASVAIFSGGIHGGHVEGACGYGRGECRVLSDVRSDVWRR